MTAARRLPPRLGARRPSLHPVLRGRGTSPDATVVKRTSVLVLRVQIEQQQNEIEELKQNLEIAQKQQERQLGIAQEQHQEMEKLKKQLEIARSRVAEMNQQLQSARARGIALLALQELNESLKAQLHTKDVALLAIREENENLKDKLHMSTMTKDSTVQSRREYQRLYSRRRRKMVAESAKKGDAKAIELQEKTKIQKREYMRRRREEKCTEGNLKVKNAQP